MWPNFSRLVAIYAYPLTVLATVQRKPVPPGFLRECSIRRVDHHVLAALRLIPGTAALLIDHAAVVDRDAFGRNGPHHRADEGRRDSDRPRDCGCPRDRVIVVVPTATAATALVVDVDIDVAVGIDVGVPVGVDVIHAAVAHIVGTRVGLTTVDLSAATAASTCASTPASTRASTPATASACRT